jgi:hypothetical protein
LGLFAVVAGTAAEVHLPAGQKMSTSNLGATFGVGGLMILVAIFSALTNPLILMYLRLSFKLQTKKQRTRMWWVLLVCMSCAYVTLRACGFVPLIGYFMWMAGIFLMLAPELVKDWEDPVDTAPEPVFGLLRGDFPQVVDVEHAQNG